MLFDNALVNYNNRIHEREIEASQIKIFTYSIMYKKNLNSVFIYKIETNKFQLKYIRVCFFLSLFYPVRLQFES